LDKSKSYLFDELNKAKQDFLDFIDSNEIMNQTISNTGGARVVDQYLQMHVIRIKKVSRKTGDLIVVLMVLNSIILNHYALSELGSGGDRIRTGVQTYSSKAFYMFIPELIVGGRQEPGKPIHPVVVIILEKQHDRPFCKRPAFCNLYYWLSRRRGLVTDKPARRPK